MNYSKIKKIENNKEKMNNRGFEIPKNLEILCLIDEKNI
jgi:hypothetical protein